MTDCRHHPSSFERTRRIAASLILIVTIVLIGFVAWAGSWRGGLQPDSVTFLDAAQRLADGKGLSHRWAYWDPVYETAHLPTRTTMWPPGYTAAIAAMIKSGCSAYDGARRVAGIALYLLPLALFGLACRMTTPGRAALCAAAAACCFPVLRFAGVVLAEPLFLLMVLLPLMAASRGATAPRARTAGAWLLTAGVLGATAFLVRLPGASLGAALAVAALWTRRRFGRRTGLAMLIPATGPLAVAIGGWVLRNRLLSGSAVASFPNGPYSLIANLREVPRNVLSEWFGWKSLYPGLLALLRPLQVGLLLVLIGLALWNAWRGWTRPRQPIVPDSAAIDPGGTGHAAGSLLVLTFLIAYAALIFAATAGKGLMAEARYFVVVLPVVTLLLTVWATSGAMRASNEACTARADLSRFTGVAATLLLCAAQATALLRWTSEPSPESYVVTTRDSPVIAWLRDHTTPDELLLTTAGAEIAMYRPNPILRVARRPHSARQTTSWSDVDELARRAGARYLIHWRNSEPNPYDAESSRFEQSLNDPAIFREREPVTLGEHIIYRVGISAGTGSGASRAGTGHGKGQSRRAEALAYDEAGAYVERSSQSPLMH
ncbi:MAG: hypothetical protein DCC66_04880 [Planctomycetota bacterium]|nr:MAG: hypothetical protein DCC66_04880 [Planctomycetota bacterium]